MSDADVEGSFTGASRASRAVKNISDRMRHRPESTFAPSDILPADGHQPYPKRPGSDLRPSYEDNRELVFGAPSGGPMSRDGSLGPASVFDRMDGHQEQDKELTTRDSEEQESYDLKAPPPNKTHANIEALSQRFFSNDHLDLIIRDPNDGPKFIQFLEQFKPHYTETLRHYIQSRKAITAVEYANSIANQIPAGDGEPPYMAAPINEAFDTKSRQIAEDLVEEALPAYLTHRLTILITDILVKTITGNNIPAMQDLVPNLAEVYCISDPSLPDNPICYASDEFFNTSQYGRDYSLGRNCRFLQGPRTSEAAVRRMAEALTAGEELCETILNYRRDGSPFMNLLMLAPMYDNKGEVKYFLGAQIDVSPLIEGGRGLDSFSRLLAEDRSKSRYGADETKDSMALLGELGQMLSDPETDFVFNRMKQSGSQHSSGRSTPVRQSSQQKRPNTRRVLSMDDAADGRPLPTLYPDVNLGRSGRLPGVYRNYLLVRPYPSLRITFTSPTLRIPGLLQTKLLDRIGGPDHLKQGILDAFRNGTGVTAKVPWIANASKGTDNGDGKPRWIHCTPMVGSDERVGVWMVVLVENEEVTGLLNRQDSAKRSVNGGPMDFGAIDERSGTPGAMYADYMRTSKDGDRPGTNGSQQTTSSTMERREVDNHFRDF